MADTTLPTVDRLGNPVSVKVDTTAGVTTPYTKQDAAQHAALLAALAALGAPAPTLKNISSAIDTGGASQVLSAAGEADAFLFLANPKNAVESLWVCDAVDPDTDLPIDADVGDGISFELAPGESYTWPKGVANQVSVTASSTAHAFIARRA